MTLYQMLDGLKAGRTLCQDGAATETEQRDVDQLVAWGLVTRTLEVVEDQYSRHVIRLKQKDDFKEWHPIDTLEMVHAEGLIEGTDSVLLWNPCDGYHLAWLLTDRPHKLAAEGREGIYTHWCLPKDPPPAPMPQSPAGKRYVAAPVVLRTHSG